jgi:hypothetical protein
MFGRFSRTRVEVSCAMSVNNTTSRASEITPTLDDFEVREHPLRRIFRSYFPLFLILWILFVLYPNPLNLIISVQRVFNLDVDPWAVEFLLNDFPSDPVAVEKAVLARIPYHYDWELYSVPWYFPTVEEVLEKGEGDCKARALVLASIFEAKNIPYQVNLSPIHIWVDYEGKEETSVENAKVKFYQRDPETGERWVQIPEIELREIVDSIWRSFWSPMPDGRKALLISGLLALVAARVILFKNRAAE